MISSSTRAFLATALTVILVSVVVDTATASSQVLRANQLLDAAQTALCQRNNTLAVEAIKQAEAWSPTSKARADQLRAQEQQLSGADLSTARNFYQACGNQEVVARYDLAMATYVTPGQMIQAAAKLAETGDQGLANTVLGRVEQEYPDYVKVATVATAVHAVQTN